MKPGTKAWRDRVNKLLAEESAQPERLFYLSFADEGFLGGVIIKTRGVTLAMIQTHELGINPGGQMAAWELPEHIEPAQEYRNRLLSREEIEAAMGPVKSIRELEEEAAK